MPFFLRKKEKLNWHLHKLMLPQFSHLVTSCCVLAAQSLLEMVSFLLHSQTHPWPSFSEQVPCPVYLQRDLFAACTLHFHLLSSSFEVSWLACSRGGMLPQPSHQSSRASPPLSPSSETASQRTSCCLDFYLSVFTEAVFSVEKQAKRYQ